MTATLVSLAINCVQICLYLSLLLSLRRQHRGDSPEYLATLIAISLNGIAILKKVFILIVLLTLSGAITFQDLTRLDKLFAFADGFLILYSVGVYLPTWVKVRRAAKHRARLDRLYRK